ncbi:hypothetical protein KGY64_03415 [Candidatus Bipolaricaulota bacterium]|nr:hypothetical protein [Candidatus Bipolaricaulota bacterium]
MRKDNGNIESDLLDYLEGFFNVLGEDPTLKVEYRSPEELYINLQGQSGFLSGEKQELAERLSTLAEVFLRRKHSVEREVQLDVNGVKLTHRKKLERFALKAAERAVHKGKKIRLNPMDPEERKWIHISLGEVDGVETYSVNEGEERRIIIKPTG